MGLIEQREPSAYALQVLLLLQTSANFLIKGHLPLPGYEVVARLVFDMPDSSKNWKNMYFFFVVKGVEWVCRPEEWVCRPEEWDGMPDRYDNTWGIVKV